MCAIVWLMKKGATTCSKKKTNTTNVWCKQQCYKMLETMYCVQPSALCKKGATGCSKPNKLNKHKCVIQMLDENDATKCSKPYITSNVCNQVCDEKKVLPGAQNQTR